MEKLSKYFEYEYIICYIEKFVSDKDELINSKNINLDDTIKKEARGIDGPDLGKDNRNWGDICCHPKRLNK